MHSASNSDNKCAYVCRKLHSTSKCTATLLTLSCIAAMPNVAGYATRFGGRKTVKVWTRAKAYASYSEILGGRRSGNAINNALHGWYLVSARTCVLMASCILFCLRISLYKAFLFHKLIRHTHDAPVSNNRPQT